ncbi:MAG: OmpA family protein [Rhizomicrobium sp.]
MKKSLISLAALALATLALAACAGAPPRSHYGYPQSYNPPGSHPPPPMEPRGTFVPPPVQSAGPLRTAAVSAYMDGEENALRARLRREGVIVARRGDGITLIVFDSALFEGAADLSGHGVELLRAMALDLRRFDRTALQIAGYTDTTGGAGQNAEISDKRAKAVAAALASDGVAPARLSAAGYGEDNPRIKTGDNVNEPRNRRIEIRITAAPVG